MRVNATTRAYNLVDNIRNNIHKIKNTVRKDKLHDIILLNKKFKNIHRGERCFILGNGPSIKECDLNILKNELVISVNQFSKFEGYKDVYSNYHIWSDNAFFNVSKKESGNDFLNVVKGIKTKDNDPECFFISDAYDYVSKHNLDKYLKINYFKHDYRFNESYNKKFDFTKILPVFYTVVHYAIALAIYMGCKEIYLLGCDCTGIISHVQMKCDMGLKGYAYDMNEEDKKRLQEMHSNDDNENLFYGQAQIFRGYKILNEYCKKRDIKLVNCSKNGILTELDCNSLENVLKNVSDN